jgi:ArsR family transcriptional regulator
LSTKVDPAAFAAAANRAARLMRALSNERRLMVLCELSEGETTVGELAERVGLSSSALSQHLAKLRADDLVLTRREAQTIFYRLGDPAAARVISLLAELYCPPASASKRKVA